MSPRRVPPEWSLAAPPGPAPSLADAAAELERAARELGFTAFGVAPARVDPLDLARLDAWLGQGHQGGMGWLKETGAARGDATTVLEGAQAVVMVGLPAPPPAPPAPGRARVATYAQGRFDYHRVLAVRLELLVLHLAALLPGARARRFCDTTPVLERAFARAAGLGFVGKNGMVIDPRLGSTFLLGGIAVDRPLPPTPPADPLPSCGSCTRCLDACPTQAFPAPYVLDARRCISYLTIEHVGPWDEALRAPSGAHVFGCDICQAVCPWNEKFAPPADVDLAPEPERAAPELGWLAETAEARFKSIAWNTPWERAGKRGFLRNVATALGNSGDPVHRALLERLAAHEDEGVREHARWALEQLMRGSGP